MVYPRTQESGSDPDFNAPLKFVCYCLGASVPPPSLKTPADSLLSSGGSIYTMWDKEDDKAPSASLEARLRDGRVEVPTDSLVASSKRNFCATKFSD